MARTPVRITCSPPVMNVLAISYLDLWWITPHQGLQAPVLIKADKRWLQRRGSFWWDLFYFLFRENSLCGILLNSTFPHLWLTGPWVRCYPSCCPKNSLVLNGGGFTSHLHQMEYSKAASSDYRCVKPIFTAVTHCSHGAASHCYVPKLLEWSVSCEWVKQNTKITDTVQTILKIKFNADTEIKD